MEFSTKKFFDLLEKFSTPTPMTNKWKPTSSIDLTKMEYFEIGQKFKKKLGIRQGSNSINPIRGGG